MDGRPNINAAIGAMRDMADATAQVLQELRNNHNNNTARNDGAKGLADFQKNNPPTFKGGFDPDGAELWIQKLEKIFLAMNCNDNQRVTYAIFMLEGEAENWWHGARQLMVAAGAAIS